MDEAKELLDKQEKDLKDLIALWKQAGRDTKRLDDLLDQLRKNRKEWEKGLRRKK